MKFKALGAYIFAGGFTLGVKKHFEVVAHLEEAAGYGVPSMEVNQPEIPVYTDAERWPLEGLARQGPIDFIYGNPPCAAWSALGPRVQRGHDSWQTDERVNCTRIHFQLLDFFRPHIWAWESVPQAWSTGRAFVHHLAERAQELGYHVSVVLHDAQYLGTPQQRRRMFMVCHDVELDFRTYLSRPRPCGPVIRRAMKGDRNPEYVKYNIPVGFFNEVGPGETLRNVRDRYLQKSGKRDEDVIRPGFAYRRADPDRPACTVTGATQIHPDLPRLMSTRELLAVCGFPLSYRLVGRSANDKQPQIARGVLPPVGNWLAKVVRDGLSASKPVSPGLVEVNLYKPGS